MSKVFGQKGVKVSSYGKENIGCMLYGVGLRRPYIRPYIYIWSKKKVWVPQLWAPYLWICMGGGRPYTGQFPSGLEAAEREGGGMRTRKSTATGPRRKQQPSAGHLSDIHLCFILEISAE